MKHLITLFIVATLSIFTFAHSFAVVDATNTPRLSLGEPYSSYYGTATAPVLSFVNDTDTGIYRKSANTIGIATNGVERVSIGLSGITALPVTVSTNATTNATLTITGADMVLGTWQNVAISTVNLIATAGIAVGTEVTIRTDSSSYDIVLAEGGNILLGATSRVLSDVADIIKVKLVNATTWVEVVFTDNN